MNRRQKLVQQRFLDNERAVISRLEYVYDQALTDIDKKLRALEFRIDDLQLTYDWMDDTDPDKARIKSMIQSKVYQKQYQQSLRDQVGGILDQMQTKQYLTVSDYLNECYEDGFVGSLFDLHGQGIPLMMPLNQEAMVRAVQLDSKISKGLYTRLGEDVALLKKKIAAQITRSIATGTTYAETAKQLAGISRAGYNNSIRITRTEGHRIQTTAAMDAMEQAKERGADVLKQWDSTLDDRTRESHTVVDGEIREMEEPFSNGLMYPGDPSGAAAEVINCRCALLQRARWALGDAELETLKERARYFGLDKSDNFDNFKKKYLVAEAAGDVPTTDPIHDRLVTFRTEADSRAARLQEVDAAVDRYYWNPDERKAHGVERAAQKEWKAAIDINALQDERIALAPQVEEDQEILDLLTKLDGRKRKTPVHSVQQYEVANFGFGDGTGTGVHHRGAGIVRKTTDGTEIIYPKDYDVTKQVMSPDEAVDVWMRIPEAVRIRSQHIIEVLDYGNPQDSYWARVYNMPGFQTYMAGGERLSIYGATYHDDDHRHGVLIHEVGHWIDRSDDGLSHFSHKKAWSIAMQKDWTTCGKKSPTTYGEVANTEDFAESLMSYYQNRDAFVRDFPERARILNLIMGE